jgi:signal recognition particle GTPase
MEIDITPKQAIDTLEQLISLDTAKKSHDQDSLEPINLNESILKLNIYSLNNVPDLLYSEEIYNDEKEIGIEMPIDRLVKMTNQTIVMIGVSGCGKTRTCYDLCRKYWGCILTVLLMILIP